MLKQPVRHSWSSKNAALSLASGAQKGDVKAKKE